MRQYPKITIRYDGIPLDPSKSEVCATEFKLSDIKSSRKIFSSQLEIVEWGMFVNREVFLCAINGLPLVSANARIHAPGHEFTAYLKSEYFEYT